MAWTAADQTVFNADHRHHHIFDSRSGYSPTEPASVTVPGGWMRWWWTRLGDPPCFVAQSSIRPPGRSVAEPQGRSTANYLGW